MPLKRYRGFNTGNTLKRCTAYGAKSEGHFRVKVNAAAVEFEGLEFASGVTYSLRKRQQWRLRELVSECLQEEDGPFSAATVEVSEGVQPPRRPTRTFYFARKPRGGRVTEFRRKRGFLNAKSISAALQDAEDSCELRFDFTAPRAALTARSSCGHVKLSSRPGGCADPRAALQDKDEIEREARRQVALDRQEDLLTPAFAAPRRRLCDFLIAKERAPRRRRCSSKSEAPVPGPKDRKVVESSYEQKEMEPPSAPASAPAWMELELPGGSQPSDALEMVPLRVSLPTTQLSRAALRAAFGSRYLEGCSEPRKFALSIGESLARELRATPETPKAAPPQALLLFEVAQPGRESTVCDVILNADVSGTRSLRIPPSAITPDLTTFMERCVAATAATLGPQLIRRATPPAFRFLRRRDSCEGPPPALGATVAASTGEWEVVEETSPEEAFEVVDPTCGACLAPLALNGSALSEAVASRGAARPGCCLIPCGHHFCGDCWRWHLGAQINLGRAQLRCPEPECAEAVDPVTALRFVSLPLYAPHSRRMPSEAGDPRLALCPEPDCNRAARLSRPPPVGQPLNVECPARHSFCFSCREEAHWPAPCVAYQLYKAKLQAQGAWGPGATRPNPGPGGGRSKHLCATVRWRLLRLRGSGGALRLDAARLNQLLLRGRQLPLSEVQREAARVLRNYEALLRCVEFAHVATLCLVKSQLATAGRVLRAAAHKLTGLAAAIRESVNCAGGPEELQSCFAQARGVLSAIQSIPALKNPACLRKVL